MANKPKNSSCKAYVKKRLPNAYARRTVSGWEIVDGDRVLDFAKAAWYAWYFAWYRLAHCTPRSVGDKKLKRCCLTRGTTQLT
jgi:hypothetical protein